MKKVVLIFIALAFTFFVWGQDSRKELRTGNKFYEAGNPVDAETAYRKALEIDANPKAAFNLGDALYRQEKYEEAGQQFEKAAVDMINKADKAMAYYNLGNALFQQQKLKESIEAYKQALRNNPSDADSKANLTYAMGLYKQQQSREQQQQNANQPPPSNKDEKEDDAEARKIKEQADKLVAMRKYQEAYDLMKEGERTHKELTQYADFTNRILDVIKMNQ